MAFAFMYVCIVCLLPGLYGLCKFPPSLTGARWLMSRSGAQLTFNKSEVDGLYLHDSLDIKPPIGNLYDCVAAKGNKYVIRSRKPSTIRKPRFVFICLHILDITPNIVTFVQASITGPGIKPLFTKFDTIGAVGSDPVEHVCDLPRPYHPSRHHVLVREGSTLQHLCPDVLHGTWRSLGLCATSLYVCDGESIEVHYQNLETCRRSAPFYPGPTPSQCVLSVQDANFTYLTVYNKNASVPFVCAVLKKSREIIYMSHRARECSSRQTHTEGEEIFDFKKYVSLGCRALKSKDAKPLKGVSLMRGSASSTTTDSSNVVIMVAIVIILTILYKCTWRRKLAMRYFLSKISAHVFKGSSRSR